MQTDARQSHQTHFFDRVLSRRLANFFLTGFFRI